MNPIVKVVTGYSFPVNGKGKIRSRRSWTYKCPDCELSRFSANTRKRAKDAYHEHRIKNHAGPGLGV